jgi:hypothetical protein
MFIGDHDQMALDADAEVAIAMYAGSFETIIPASIGATIG